MVSWFGRTRQSPTQFFCVHIAPSYSYQLFMKLRVVYLKLLSLDPSPFQYLSEVVPFAFIRDALEQLLYWRMDLVSLRHSAHSSWYPCLIVLSCIQRGFAYSCRFLSLRKYWRIENGCYIEACYNEAVRQRKDYKEKPKEAKPLKRNVNINVRK